ncbi:hypothetical protein [Clostridium sp. Marseille-Q2269]|uniref:hypothetical protein n=1 Tax=Clostridium sp. Marseille-Q2269 TaxID=2942205 RepID=UPI0020735E0F|nr:hypothetical protein [Clostridium sp. Marseille-Q2269]
MGANIKIKSESKSFQDDMKKVVQDLKTMNSELGVVTTKAELFGSETDKLGAKSKTLSQNIKGQTKLLDLQRKTMSSLTGDIGKYKNRNEELGKSIKDVETKLKDEIKANGENSKEAKKLTKELNSLQKEYKANEKAIDKAENNINKYREKTAETEKAILKNNKALEETNKKLKNQKWEELSAKMDKANNKMVDVGGKIANVGSSLTTRLTLPIVGLGGASVKMASDLDENMNKVNSVFGKNADGVKKWSETSIEKMGMASSTALDMSSKFGDMATSMGLPIDKSASMSKNLTQLGADLASFKNISLDQASTALTSVFTGETESLKGLGIVMTETNLQSFALASGFKKSSTNSVEAQKAALAHEKAQKSLNEAIKSHGQNSMQAREADLKVKESQEKLTKAMKGGKLELTEAEKVQLRYNYVMDKTKNAQGDFQKTGAGTANQMRMLRENVKQLGASVGQELIPQVLPWIKKANEWVKGLSKMDTGTKNLIVSIGKFAAITAPAIMVVGKGISFIGNFNKGIKSTIGFMRDLPSNTKKTITSIKDFNKNMGNGVKSIANFTKNIGKATFTKFTNGLKLAGNGAKTAGMYIGTFAKNVALATRNIAKAGFTKLANGLKLVGQGALTAGRNIATFAKNVAVAGLNAAKATISFIAQKTALIAHKIATIASTAAQTALNVVMNMNPIVLIVTLIGTLVLALVHLYKTNDKVRAIMDKCWNGIKTAVITVVNGIKASITSAWNGIKSVTQTVWGGIKMLIVNPIKGAVDFIKGAVEKIKGFFNNMHIKLPNIKLPHFSLEGEFSLKKMSVPHLAVNWYSEGGIFTRPTILGGIGVGDANRGFGRNAEAVLPLNQLWNKLNDNFDRLAQRLENNTNKNGDVIIKIENFNGTKQDMRNLAQELEFMTRQQKLARGGKIK